MPSHELRARSDGAAGNDRCDVGTGSTRRGRGRRASRRRIEPLAQGATGSEPEPEPIRHLDALAALRIATDVGSTHGRGEGAEPPQLDPSSLGKASMKSLENRLDRTHEVDRPEMRVFRSQSLDEVGLQHVRTIAKPPVLVADRGPADTVSIRRPASSGWPAAVLHAVKEPHALRKGSRAVSDAATSASKSSRV